MSVIAVNFRDFYYIAPEIVLTIWGLLVLTVDFSLLRHRAEPGRRQVLGWLSLVGAVLALVVVLLPTLLDVYAGIDLAARFGIDAGEPDPSIFFGTLAGDSLTRWFNGLLALLLAMTIGLSMAGSFTEHWGEYFALLFWATVGMMFLVASEELLTLFLTLEMMTLCLYLCTAFEKGRRRSAEGGLKYFVYGSVSSALFLFGLSLIYGLTGTTRLDAIHEALLAKQGASIGLGGNVAGATAVLLVLAGFGFKIAAVPFHQWAPDAYEGAPAPVSALIASGSKVASVIALMKVLVHALGPWASSPQNVLSPGWIGIVALISAVTMTYGNFAALGQRNLKRMLAYSSIAHAGYILVGVLAASVSLKDATSLTSYRNDLAAGSVLFYLVVYGISTVGAFAVAAWLARDKAREDIDDLNGLGTRSPALALCIVVLMLSLIGLPPFAGFFGKLYMFMEALKTREQGRVALLWLVALGLLNSVVSAFYYVRVLKAIYLRPPGDSPIGPPSRAIAWPIALATLVVVGFGLYPTPLVEAMGRAAIPMLSSGGSGAIVPDSAATGQARPPGRVAGRHRESGPR